MVLLSTRADQQKPGFSSGLPVSRQPFVTWSCRGPGATKRLVWYRCVVWLGRKTVRWYDVLQNRSRMGGPVLGGRLPISANLLFYYCFGGTHSSPVAAALHLGLLSQAPSLAEIQSIPHFDRLPHKQVGTPLFWGRDVEGKLVCTIGTAGKIRQC